MIPILAPKRPQFTNDVEYRAFHKIKSAESDHDADDEDNDDNEVKEDGIGIAVGERSGIRCR